MSYILDTTINTISNQSAALYYSSTSLEDQILQLMQGILNLIIQTINLTVEKVLNRYIGKVLDQRLGLDRCRPAFMNEDLLNVVRKKPEKDWRLKEIRFFHSNCEKSSLIIISNCHG